MNKCIRITLTGKPKGDFLNNVVKKSAQKYDIEGVAQVSDSEVKIVACGNKDKVDEFLDVLQQELTKSKIDNIEIEPFLKDKDYRGIFRIIE